MIRADPSGWCLAGGEHAGNAGLFLLVPPIWVLTGCWVGEATGSVSLPGAELALSRGTSGRQGSALGEGRLIR